MNERKFIDLNQLQIEKGIDEFIENINKKIYCNKCNKYSQVEN